MSSNASKSSIPDWPVAYLKCSELYFIADKDYLYCLGTNYRIPIFSASLMPSDIEGIKREYPLLFHLCSLGYKQDQAIPIYDVIHGALIGRRFTSYYKALLKFKWKTGLSSFPLFDLQQYIEVRDGKLWGLVEHKGQICWKLLTDEVVAQEIKRCGGHECSDNSLKVKLAKELLNLHPEQSTQDENPGQIDVDTPYFHISYNQLLNQAEVVRPNGFRFHIASPSSSLRNFLRTIAGGSSDRLDDFAELLARLYRPSLISKYVWVIMGNVPQINNFLRLLQDLSKYKSGSAIYKSDSAKAPMSLADDQGKGRNVQVNPQIGCSISFKNVNRSRLIKFATGEVIGSIVDPYIINGEVTGKGVLLYAAQELDENCLEKIPHKIIHISDECQFSEITADDCWWLQTCLLCHGFHLLSMPEAETLNETLSVDQALRKFVNSFCEIRAGAWTDRKQFHEKFKRYCDSCINLEGKILGPNKFSDYVQETLCWKSRTIRSYKNRLAFDGIYMDVAKLESFIRDQEKTNTAQDSAANSYDFDAYLDSFSKYLYFPGTMQTV